MKQARPCMLSGRALFVHPTPAVADCVNFSTQVLTLYASHKARMISFTESPQGGVVWVSGMKARMDDDANRLVNLSDEMMKVCITTKAISVMGFQDFGGEKLKPDDDLFLLWCHAVSCARKADFHKRIVARV
jgi:hypothetical protein